MPICQWTEIMRGPAHAKKRQPLIIFGVAAGMMYAMDTLLFSYNLPGLVGEGKSVGIRGPGHPVHVPNHVSSRARVAPQDVCLAVVIEVTRADNLPGLVGVRRDVGR